MKCAINPVYGPVVRADRDQTTASGGHDPGVVSKKICISGCVAVGGTRRLHNAC